MSLSNLTPGKKPLGGSSVRLSAYLMPHQAARLEAHLSGQGSAYARSRELARLVMVGLEADRDLDARLREIRDHT